jgi:ADP-ribosylglycohydrolase
MDSAKSLDRFLGSVIGAAVGDAVGAPPEFWPADKFARIFGGDWVADMYPFVERGIHHLGLWRDDPPKGTSTDDTRHNQVFIEAVLKHGLAINSQCLAMEHIDRYLNRDRYYPGYHDLATRQFSYGYVQGCAHLGIECPLRPGVPPHVTNSHAQGSGYPSAMGLFSIPAAGLLHPGDGDATYKQAFELDYQDFGFARDAFAILATIIGLSLDESLSPREAIRKGLEVDPYDLGATGWSRPTRAMVAWSRRCLDIADEAKDERELVVRISREVAGEPGFGSKDLLGFPLAAAYYANGDPRRAILIAVNARDVDAEGNLVRFRDTDCTGSACGALVGAMSGLSAFPPDWVEACLAANREEYGFELEASARALHQAVVGG